MLLGQLAEATGVSRRSLRYYESVGLICAERTNGGWRRFSPETVDRVITVQHLFAAGLRSATIVRILPCLQAPCSDRTGYLEDQLELEIDRLKGKKCDLEREIDVLRELRGEPVSRSGTLADRPMPERDGNM